MLSRHAVEEPHLGRVGYAHDAAVGEVDGCVHAVVDLGLGQEGVGVVGGRRRGRLRGGDGSRSECKRSRGLKWQQLLAMHALCRLIQPLRIDPEHPASSCCSPCQTPPPRCQGHPESCITNFVAQSNTAEASWGLVVCYCVPATELLHSRRVLGPRLTSDAFSTTFSACRDQYGSKRG